MNLEQLENKKIEILEFFKDLSFKEDTHQYFIKDRAVKYSVSGIVKRFEEPFKKNYMAERVALSRGISKEEVLIEWKNISKESLRIGNAAHLFGENYVFDRSLIPEDGYQRAVAKFWDELPDFIIPVFAELRCYHKTRFYAGTMDQLLYNTLNNTFMIGDYKSNKDLFKNYKGKMLTGKFNDLLDTPFNKYQIQLNYYQELIEQVPGIKISKRKIIWIKPDGEYELFDCEDYSDRIAKKVKNNLKWN